MKESVLQIIHNLTDIKNQLNDLAPIEKDILLQEIRQLYVSVLEAETAKTEEAVPVVMPAKEEPKEEQVVEAQETPAEEPAMDFETKEEEPAPEPEIIAEETIEEPAPAVEPEPEIADPEPIEPEPVADEPAVAEQPEVAATLEPEPADIADDLLQFLPKEMTEEKAVAEQPAEKTAEEKVAEFSNSLFPEELSAEPEATKEEPVAQPVQPEPKPVEQPKPAQPEPPTTPEKRSLNDLLQAQHEENSIFNKMQQSKINDLLKAISLNDKFLFIKELFQGKGEDFSLNIQKLNNCANLDEAFEELELMKKHYFWESTSEAYLSLCDLIRRRYIS